MHVGQDPGPVGAQRPGGVVEVGVDPAHPGVDGEERERVEPHQVGEHQAEDRAGEHQPDRASPDTASAPLMSRRSIQTSGT